MAAEDEGLGVDQDPQPDDGDASNVEGGEAGEDQELPLPYRLDEDGKPIPLQGVESLFLTGASLFVRDCDEVEQSG